MRNWGESFLKSGLPLEHLALVTLRSLDWFCTTHVEYQRENREKTQAWFERDLEATAPYSNSDMHLILLMECKYHDASRFWFFLPHERYRWHFDDRVLNPMPLQTLAEPHGDSLLSLAPASVWGVVVSESGEKQDNAAHAAVEQLANGFVPFALVHGFAYNLDIESLTDPATFGVIPVVVTNARIYRLKPSVTDLDIIRKAAAPDEEVADELSWTWCYFEPSMVLVDQNMEAIKKHIRDEGRIVHRYPGVEERLHKFGNRPNWIAVINAKSLSTVVTAIQDYFLQLKVRSMSSLLQPRGKTKSRTTTKGRSTTASS